ncbi:MAG: OST-HTH/LOTUS domain-containing protein, partial [Polaromonas sp.]
SFDHRNFGYATLTKLLVATQLFDIIEEGKSTVMVRDKRLSRPARN